MKVFLFLLLLSSLLWAETSKGFSFTQQVQPAMVWSPDDVGFELQRAILGIKPSYTIGSCTLESDFKLEFVGYDNLDKLVKKATVTALIHPSLEITAGRVRVPFGENHWRASRKLDRISRSHTASYIKKQLSIGERSEGVLLAGEVGSYVSYECGIFNYSNNQRNSQKITSLPGNSVLTLQVKPLTGILLGYSYDNFLVSAREFHNRLSAHDMFLQIHTPEHIEFKSEFFVGPDSLDIAAATPYLPGVKEHLGMSLYTTATYKHTLGNKRLDATLFWERLWGSTQKGDIFTERELVHAFGVNIRFRFQEFIYLDLEVEERLDGERRSLQEPEVSLQWTYYNKIKR